MLSGGKDYNVKFEVSKAVDIKLMKNRTVRGTQAANDLVKTLKENWDQMRKAYDEQDDAEKEEILDYFNSTLDNFGELLFGADSEKDDLEPFVNVLADEECDKFVHSVNEGCFLQK